MPTTPTAQHAYYHALQYTGDQCLHWQGSTDHRGRPKIWAPELQRAIKVRSRMLQPGPGAAVVHTPDPTDRLCVNPHHLEVRTSWTRLTDDQIEDIRTSTEPLNTLAERHHVDPSYISRIRNRHRF